MTTGKTFLDVRQALEDLGIDALAADEIGLSLYEVALVWPLEPRGALRFASRLDEILFGEEERPLIEEQLAALLCNEERRPRIHGRREAQGEPLVSSVGELSSRGIADVLRRWLGQRIRLPEPSVEGESLESSVTVPDIAWRRLAERVERIVINQAVCEGRGDGSAKSNCIAIEPVETDLGRKRPIDQSGCNKDFWCLEAYCPSFAIVEGAELRDVASGGDRLSAETERLPDPDLVIGCHIALAAGADSLSKLSPELTTAVVDRRVGLTSDFASSPDLDPSAAGMEDSIRSSCRPGATYGLDASRLATTIMGTRSRQICSSWAMPGNSGASP